MQGLLENLPVALMAVLLDWPLFALLLGLPALLAVLAWRRRAPGARVNAALPVGFAAGTLLGPLLAGFTDGGFAALGYWVDWAFVLLAAGAGGTWLGLNAWLAANLLRRTRRNDAPP